MTRLSVNINKIALLRNSRDTNIPHLIQTAIDCEAFGADGITVHPRPDQRHIRYSDIPLLKSAITTEFNIEGYPSEEFMRLVLRYLPTQCTLVPDPPHVLTSQEGWDTAKHQNFLRPIVKRLTEAGIRVSIFLDPKPHLVEAACELGAQRIELYTGQYAREFPHNPQAALLPHRLAAAKAKELGMGLNAGHDLNLSNLRYYKDGVEDLLEVSIGHALICDALYYGLENTIAMYKSKLT